MSAHTSIYGTRCPCGCSDPEPLCECGEPLDQPRRHDKCQPCREHTDRMPMRDRWHRIIAYARACKRRADYAARVGWTPSDPGNLGAMLTLADHERHAWWRLPDNVRAQVQG